MYRGHMDVVLVYVEHTSPMPQGCTSQLLFLHLFSAFLPELRRFEEDCHELQEACNAEGLGPETSGYWPPLRIFDHSFWTAPCSALRNRARGMLAQVMRRRFASTSP